MSAIKLHGWDNLIKEIIYEVDTKEGALKIEKNLRPVGRIGWNILAGGDVGVSKDWYADDENAERHRKITAEKTKEGIRLKDTAAARSARQKQAHIDHKESYKGAMKGEKNPRALLSEASVREIKYNLIPQGIPDLDIAAMFGVKKHVIYFIRKGKNWKHI